MNSEFESDCLSSKYKWIKLYAYLDNGYLMFSIHKDLHKKNYDCYRVPSKDTQVVIEVETKEVV
jgi:hypothetical protein